MSEPVLSHRLRKRQSHVGRWGRRRGLEAFRLYERDIPDYPLIVDRYGAEIVVWLRARRRDEDDAAAAAAYRSDALSQIRAGLDCPVEKLFIKERQAQRGRAQYQRLAETGAVRQVIENGLRFEVNLSDYLDVGLFLDHRDTRQRLRQEVAGKTVLNLFAYTGSFSVYAAAGEAAEILSVDLSATYCAWARRNLEANQFTDRQRCRILQHDCLQFLAEAPQQRFDCIVCDPPTFSNSKRMQRSWAIARDHPWLLWRLFDHCAPGGTVYFSTNDRGFQLAEAGLPPFEYRELTPASIPEDFRNRLIHRCWLLRKL